jgi:nucleoside-diphosphate-sugar epimerase
MPGILASRAPGPLQAASVSAILRALQRRQRLKALVTGATGFVGSHLVERLLVAGMDVACLMRPTSNPAALAGLAVERRIAVLEDPAALTKAVRGVDYIFHCAGLTRGRNLAQYMSVNADGTRRLIEAALAENASLQRFVYVSSLAAAGPATSPEPPDESATPHPSDDYGASKLAGERVVLEYADRLPVTIIRPPAVYGPRDTNFLPLFRAAARLRRVPVIGKPSKQVAFVYATDLAEGLLLAAQNPLSAGRTYFIASGIHTMTEVAQAVCAALNIPPRMLRVPTILARLIGEIGQIKWALTGRAQIISRRKVRDMLQPRWTCSWARARTELGYREAVGLTEGMRATAQWYIENGWLKGRRGK